MVLVGYRRIRQYLVMIAVMVVLFGLYAKFVGIRTVYLERGRKSADIKCVSSTPSEPSDASLVLAAD